MFDHDKISVLAHLLQVTLSEGMQPTQNRPKHTAQVLLFSPFFVFDSAPPLIVAVSNRVSHSQHGPPKLIHDLFSPC
jgi:hypothetical protein